MARKENEEWGQEKPLESLDGEDPDCLLKKFQIHSVENRENISNKGN